MGKKSTKIKNQRIFQTTVLILAILHIILTFMVYSELQTQGSLLNWLSEELMIEECVGINC